MPIVLAPNEEAIAQRVAELVTTQAKPVLTLEQAIRHTNHESRSAFRRWCKKWRVVPCTHGRYARGHLDRALEREAQPRARARKLSAA